MKRKFVALLALWGATLSWAERSITVDVVPEYGREGCDVQSDGPQKCPKLIADFDNVYWRLEPDLAHNRSFKATISNPEWTEKLLQNFSKATTALAVNAVLADAGGGNPTLPVLAVTKSTAMSLNRLVDTPVAYSAWKRGVVTRLQDQGVVHLQFTSYVDESVKSDLVSAASVLLKLGDVAGLLSPSFMAKGLAMKEARQTLKNYEQHFNAAMQWKYQTPVQRFPIYPEYLKAVTVRLMVEQEAWASARLVVKSRPSLFTGGAREIPDLTYLLASAAGSDGEGLLPALNAKIQSTGYKSGAVPPEVCRKLVEAVVEAGRTRADGALLAYAWLSERGWPKLRALRDQNDECRSYLYEQPGAHEILADRILPRSEIKVVDVPPSPHVAAFFDDLKAIFSGTAAPEMLRRRLPNEVTVTLEGPLPDLANMLGEIGPAGVALSADQVIAALKPLKYEGEGKICFNPLYQPGVKGTVKARARCLKDAAGSEIEAVVTVDELLPADAEVARITAVQLVAKAKPVAVSVAGGGKGPSGD